MLDISPQIEQAIISQAQQQGVSTNDYLAELINEPIDFALLDKCGLYSDLLEDNAVTLTEADVEPKQTKALKDLVALGATLV